MFSSIKTHYYVPRLTWAEIRRLLDERPGVIVPVAGMEPFGKGGAVGAASACCMAVADRLSRAQHMLLAPPLLWGLSTPFRCFAGCSGLKRQTFQAAVFSACSDYVRQGCRAVFVISTSIQSHKAVHGALARLHSAFRGIAAIAFQWPDKESLENIDLDKDSPRHERAFLSVASEVEPSLVRPKSHVAAQGNITPDEYARWCRRGQDPDKFRTLYPEGITADTALEPNAVLGKRILDEAVDRFARAIEKTMNTKP